MLLEHPAQGSGLKSKGFDEQLILPVSLPIIN
jgi:hypothetical protein